MAIAAERHVCDSKRLVLPGLPAEYTQATASIGYVPPGALPLDGAAGTCNAYYPNTNVYDRFLWMIGFLARNDFVVIVDDHLVYDRTAVTNLNLWYQVRRRRGRPAIHFIQAPRKRVVGRTLCKINYSMFKWCAMSAPVEEDRNDHPRMDGKRATCLCWFVCPPAQRYKQLLRDVNKDAVARGRVIFDILNEPDQSGLRWEQVGDWYHRVMAYGHAINPSEWMHRRLAGIG